LELSSTVSVLVTTLPDEISPRTGRPREAGEEDCG
jgi:hypothetical protein